jgi:LytR cell envelope-related transcriptional attenuator
LEAQLSAHDLVRPWRRATLVASAIAAVELVGLVLCLLVIVAKPLAHAVQRHARKATASTPLPAHVRNEIKHQATPPAKPLIARHQTKVLVLNGNGRNGAAHAEASRLHALGYQIAGAADAKRHDYATSVVMYKTGFRTEGVRLAHDLHVPVVGPLDGIRPAALAGGQLAVIIGAR